MVAMEVMTTMITMSMVFDDDSNNDNCNDKMVVIVDHDK